MGRGTKEYTLWSVGLVAIIAVAMFATRPTLQSVYSLVPRPI